MGKEIKIKSPKLRNHFTMTESAFWSFIRSNLRRASRFWKPVLQCKQDARRKYNGVNKRQKWEYQCAECKGWFNDKEVKVDHKTECGSLKSAQDLPGFVERLFCEVDGLQVLCDVDHDRKTLEYKQSKIKEE